MDDLTLNKFSRRSFLQGLVALAGAAAVPVELIEKIETVTPAFEAGYQIGQRIVEGEAEGLNLAWIELNGVRYPLEGLAVTASMDYLDLPSDVLFEAPRPVRKNLSIDCQVELKNIPPPVSLFYDLVNFKVQPYGLDFNIAGSGLLTRLDTRFPPYMAEFTIVNAGNLTYAAQGY